ncbi:hypothetical protein N9B46_05780 [Mariniblastus sp.]|nr:hypothetical protein [Mariniblastus sp.]
MSLFSFQDIITATTGILILLALVLALSVIIQGAESEIETDYADDKQIAQRDILANEVNRLSELLSDMNQASSTWVNSTPSELKEKIQSATIEENRFQREIRNFEKLLRDQKDNYLELDLAIKSTDLKNRIGQQDDANKAAAIRLSELKSADRIFYNFRANSREVWLVEISGTKIITYKPGSNSAPREFDAVWKFNKHAASLKTSEQYFVLFLKPSGMSNYNKIYSYLDENNCEIGLELIGESQTVVDPDKGTGF